MTKANANAAANAQEQQAAQQQILRDLLALGKKNGRLTLKEISDGSAHRDFHSMCSKPTMTFLPFIYPVG